MLEERNYDCGDLITIEENYIESEEPVPTVRVSGRKRNLLYLERFKRRIECETKGKVANFNCKYSVEDRVKRKSGYNGASVRKNIKKRYNRIIRRGNMEDMFQVKGCLYKRVNKRGLDAWAGY